MARAEGPAKQTRTSLNEGSRQMSALLDDTNRLASGEDEPTRAEQSGKSDPAIINARLDRLVMCWPIWMIVGQLSLAFFFELYAIFVTGYIAPSLVQSGILTATTQGLFGLTGVASFVAALFAGLSIGTLSTGFLADWLGRRTVFLAALVWFAVASTIMAFQQSAFGLNLFRFFAGLGLGVEMVTISTYISEIVPKQVRGRAFAFNQTLGFAAVPTVAFLSLFFASHPLFGWDGWRWVVLIGALGAGLAFFTGLSLLESPRWLAAQGRLAEADKLVSVLEERVSHVTGQPLAALPPTATTRQHVGSFADVWRPPYRRRALMLVVFNVFQTVGFYGFVNWAPTLLVSRGVTIVHSLTYVSVIALAAPVGPLLGILFADRFERKYGIMLSAGLVAALGTVFGLTHTPAVVIATGVGITLFQNILSFSYHAYQTELFPTPIRAKAVGFVYAWSRISAMFSAFIIAYVLRLAGIAGVFALIAAAMLIVVAVIGPFGPRTLGRSVDGEMEESGPNTPSMRQQPR